MIADWASQLGDGDLERHHMMMGAWALRLQRQSGGCWIAGSKRRSGAGTGSIV